MGKLNLVDFMNGKGLDHSFANRAKLAAQYGINNYSGTAEQNQQLQNILEGSGKSKASNVFAGRGERGYLTGKPVSNKVDPTQLSKYAESAFQSVLKSGISYNQGQNPHFWKAVENSVNSAYPGANYKVNNKEAQRWNERYGGDVSTNDSYSAAGKERAYHKKRVNEEHLQDIKDKTTATGVQMLRTAVTPLNTPGHLLYSALTGKPVKEVLEGTVDPDKSMSGSKFLREIGVADIQNPWYRGAVDFAMDPLVVMTGGKLISNGVASLGDDVARAAAPKAPLRNIGYQADDLAVNANGQFVSRSGGAGAGTVPSNTSQIPLGLGHQADDLAINANGQFVSRSGGTSSPTIGATSNVSGNLTNHTAPVPTPNTASAVPTYNAAGQFVKPKGNVAQTIKPKVTTNVAQSSTANGAANGATNGNTIDATKYFIGSEAPAAQSAVSSSIPTPAYAGQQAMASVRPEVAGRLGSATPQLQTSVPKSNIMQSRASTTSAASEAYPHFSSNTSTAKPHFSSNTSTAKPSFRGSSSTVQPSFSSNTSTARLSQANPYEQMALNTKPNFGVGEFKPKLNFKDEMMAMGKQYDMPDLASRIKDGKPFVPKNEYALYKEANATRTIPETYKSIQSTFPNESAAANYYGITGAGHFTRNAQYTPGEKDFNIPEFNPRVYENMEQTLYTPGTYGRAGHPDFVRAFREARAAMQDEFVWNGKRYKTTLGTPGKMVNVPYRPQGYQVGDTYDPVLGTERTWGGKRLKVEGPHSATPNRSFNPASEELRVVPAEPGIHFKPE